MISISFGTDLIRMPTAAKLVSINKFKIQIIV